MKFWQNNFVVFLYSFSDTVFYTACGMKIDLFLLVNVKHTEISKLNEIELSDMHSTCDDLK